MDYYKVKKFHEFKYNTGWGVIGLIMFVIVWNVAIITRQAIGIILDKLKSHKAKRRMFERRLISE